MTIRQGTIVRDLKAAKATKADIDAGVAILKALKEEYKKLTGHDVPAAAPAAPAGSSVSHRLVSSLIRSSKASPRPCGYTCTCRSQPRGG
jgi:bifunctional glutamyl/prolyl-tRNA synthetase